MVVGQTEQTVSYIEEEDLREWEKNGDLRKSGEIQYGEGCGGFRKHSLYIFRDLLITKLILSVIILIGTFYITFTLFKLSD